ncbi:ABC transporter ATP-binding protein [Paraburkholderia sp. MMS20-SJTR3]|uniref:ABC transporter ATP-binding protein n=1 Tax=Paraburkholderia sejongensis TaxID=2886946 RepID=A0ABS8K1A6_9BURK|nr:ABC transporter ATP-binding protein [Paraburkholderia sp. MMS20-SJTR3]MCC8395937.1 ABC transporter ATP-binding protein [Paraburkholderia sp. MMS20-SJTR3]
MRTEPQSATPPLLLQATGVNAWYGSSHALRGVDVGLREGETLALMGRNGMGKSTLIRSLLGHIRTRSGQIRINGIDVSSARPHVVARMGVAYVPEGRGVFPNLSVKENLLLAGRPGADGSRQWTLERVLETFPRLQERLANGGAQLSGGEQQMLAIGRALITNPLCVILDEATEGLAPKIVQEIWNVISVIRANGIATVIVDRNYRAVLEQADRALILEKGCAVASAPAAEIAADGALLQRYLGV